MVMAISEKDQQYDSSELVKDLRTYRPKYPLPEELQGICTEDTFCAYCGVSYLILNEIKFLENTADNLRKELDFFKRNQGLDSLVRVSHTDLSAYDDKETSECIKRLLQEKGEIIQQLDDAKTKLFCYEATEKQFVKEIAKSQATVSYTQEQLIELLDYLKKIRNKLRDGLFTDGQLRPICDKINSLRGHISELNKIYNISLSQLNNQFNQLTGKVDSISLEKDSIVNKFNELELKYKEERNRWSEDRGQQLADILGILKTKLSEETKRCNNIHEEKRQLISNFEQTINHLKEENQSVLKLNNHLNTSLEMGKQEIFELKTLKNSQNDLCKQLQGKLQEMEKEFSVEQQNKKLTLEKEWKLSLEKKETPSYYGTMKEEINQLTNTVNNSNSIRTELENQVQKYQQEVKSILVFFCFIFHFLIKNCLNFILYYITCRNVKQLYVTIEKECWERDELSSTLAETREQLMKLTNSSQKSQSDQKQPSIYENQKDTSLLPPITSPSIKSEQSAKRTVSKSSKTISSNNGIAKRSLQNSRNTNGTFGLAATRRQIAAIISATKF
ncbi:leucine- glutamate- and lysine-rich 1 [Schistosoma japonicum]|nr:leucine- glutamate- and lysine-rich 1 [Schistosoma japonicum]